MRLNQKILSVIAAASLLITLSACSSTHEARLPTDCNIQSLKKLLPSLDLMYKDEPGNSKYLTCSTLPLESQPASNSKIWDRQWKEGISIWYSKGSGGYTDAEIAKNDLEVVETNGCRVVTVQNPGHLLTSTAMCKGFLIQIYMPAKTRWSYGLELAQAAIVGLIQ
jgi:hypothetical protein